uniref:Nuclear transport factor 2 n=1 Tax=Phallusia mammillata TaxID=59560 RepID=A0A6F9DNP6_9ASCI|nr:probable nuclear transport factor 2 [Phallusia mammillata]
MNPQCELIATNFAQVYYSAFQGDRSKLKDLYCEASQMTFEGKSYQGTADIMKKLQELPFKKVMHSITSFDCQPILGVDGGEAVTLVIMGQLKTDDDPPHSFVQNFLLRKAGDAYVIGNEMFRMVLHHS